MTRTVIFNGRISTAEIRKVQEHYEVYLDGKFIASADWLREAREELEKICER